MLFEYNNKTDRNMIDNMVQMARHIDILKTELKSIKDQVQAISKHLRLVFEKTPEQLVAKKLKTGEFK